MMQSEAGDAAREAWMASLDAVAAFPRAPWIPARAEAGRRA